MSKIKKCEICGGMIEFIHEEVGWIHFDNELEQTCAHPTGGRWDDDDWDAEVVE